MPGLLLTHGYFIIKDSKEIQTKLVRLQTWSKTSDREIEIHSRLSRQGLLAPQYEVET